MVALIVVIVLFCCHIWIQITAYFSFLQCRLTKELAADSQQLMELWLKDIQQVSHHETSRISHAAYRILMISTYPSRACPLFSILFSLRSVCRRLTMRRRRQLRSRRNCRQRKTPIGYASHASYASFPLSFAVLGTFIFLHVTIFLKLFVVNFFYNLECHLSSLVDHFGKRELAKVFSNI